MAIYLEMWTPSGPQLVVLTGERLTLGSEASNDLAIGADRTVSRLHAVFIKYPTGWSVRDLASRNGTFVNAQRIWHERALRDGDEVRVGAARLIYRVGEPGESSPSTEAAAAVPDLTRRERDVLVQLCRPMLEGNPFIEPASAREIAEALVVTEGAVKQHLLNLYHKFGISGERERRRLRLANEAVRREAVTYADLRHDGREP
jgi:DNA-binding CsgD family transcriptional regulator